MRYFKTSLKPCFLILKLHIEKIVIFVKNLQLFLNKRNRNKYFAVSHFKCPIQLVQNQICRKSVIFLHFATKTCSKTDYRENCNRPPSEMTTFFKYTFVTKILSVPQFTWTLQLLLHKRCRKKTLFHNPSNAF